jgi:hypothetical protein
MTKERERLPNRRASETLQFEHGGFRYVASLSRFADGRLAEVFLSGPKTGTDVASAARDSSIVASIALQHGCLRRPSVTALAETRTARPRDRWVSCSTCWPRKRLRPDDLALEVHVSDGCECELTGMYELLDAIEAVISASDPDKRELLAKTIDAYCEDFPDDFFWAIGPQSPTLLSHIVMLINSACRSPSQSKPRPVIRLMDRTKQ